MKPLRIALTKGRLEKDTIALLERIGYDCGAVHNKGRKLILPVGNSLEVVLAKAADVITYVCWELREKTLLWKMAPAFMRCWT